MSLDASLKSASALVRHRNVLSRAERLEKLVTDGKWEENKSILGLPKVANRKMAVGGKSTEKAAEGEEATADAGKGAAGKAAPAKAAAPAKDAGKKK